MYSDFITPDSRKWSEVLTSIRHDFYHLPQYTRLCAEQEGGTPVAFVAEEDGNCLFLPLIARPICAHSNTMADLSDATSAYGYAGPLLQNEDGEVPSEDFCRRAVIAMKSSLKERRIVNAFVRLNSLFDSPLDLLGEHGRLVRHGETVFVDLTLSEDEIWRHTRAGHRTDITRSKKNHFVAEADSSWNSLRDFVELYTETMQRVNAAAYYFFSSDYFERIRDEMGSVFHLVTVRIDGDVASAALFSEVCGIVQYHLSGTGDQFLRLHPSKIMLDFVRYWAKERGNRVFHLGGGFGAKNDSLFKFKAGFSKLRKPFFTWRVVADEEMHDMLTRRWEDQSGMKADAPDGFFPAYRKPLATALEETTVR